ncbi:PPK2 family polyphosphate kinase [Aeromicrobium massiliense]|uniref:PPK2 family polyphosphate kinase n=1 Tax=Aeromicrobium massiliense TaxID=1464554 RepID=UPI0002EE554D|nr:PPK2 family polyphosphate kinase [Aeromicrobium massiliense]
MTDALTPMLRAQGPIDLSALDSRATPGFDGDKADGQKALRHEVGDVLALRQEQLYARGTTGARERVLLVLQGMDTSGKGGTIAKVAGLMDPLGVRVASFKRPTSEELEHDFLWRIEKQVPAPGMVGVFDRSHYEDVLVARVHELAPPDELERRYDAIDAFERRLVDDGVTVVKCFLHIDLDDQRERLAARLDDPAKHWKYDPGDLDERARWDDYQRAYEVAIERCSSVPWTIVPSGHKWYRNWAVGTVLAEAMEAMGLDWPEPGFDVDAERARLAAAD